MIFDPEIRYGCVRCGKSCSHDWDIWVHRDLPSRIAPHLAGLGLTSDTAFVQEEGRVRLARDSHGCRFLQDNLCSLHCQLGVRYKPDFCRQYPWFFIDTPDGLRVSASYTCTAVLQAEGPPLSDQRAELEQCLDRNPAVAEIVAQWDESRDFHRRFEEAVSSELWALCLLRCLEQARSGRSWDALEPSQGQPGDMSWPRRLVLGALLKPCLDHDQRLWEELDRALEDGGEVKIPQFDYCGSGAQLLEWCGTPFEEESELERYRRSLWFRRQHLLCDNALAGLLVNWAPVPLYRVLARLTDEHQALARIEMTIGHGRGIERVFGLLSGCLF